MGTGKFTAIQKTKKDRNLFWVNHLTNYMAKKIILDHKAERCPMA